MFEYKTALSKGGSSIIFKGLTCKVDYLNEGFAGKSRYETCRGIISKARQYPAPIILKECEIAISKILFSSRAFGNLLDTINKSDILQIERPQEPHSHRMRKSPG